MTTAEPSPPPREPLFRAPWPIVALAIVLVAAYAVQSRFGDAAVLAYGLIPARVTAGHPLGLLSAIFIHGGWAHVLLNATFALAFGAPLARLFMAGRGGALVFFAFFLLCGVLSGLAYVALHPQGMVPVVGASGAVAGLMGASARLMTRDGSLGPVLSRPVLSLAGALVVTNLIFGLLGQAPGSGGQPIAWEVHLAGFTVGLLLIGPLARISRRT